MNEAEAQRAIRIAEDVLARADLRYVLLADRCRRRETGVRIEDLVTAASELALARGDLRRARRELVVVRMELQVKTPGPSRAAG